MANPIGHPDDDIVSPGASGSLNSKFRAATLLLQQISDKTGTISGSGLVVTTTFPAVIGVSGSVDNPVLTDTWDPINHLLRTTPPLPIPNPLGVSGTVSVNPHDVRQAAGPWAVSGSIDNPVLTDVWDPINHQLRTNAGTLTIPQPLAVSGTVSVDSRSLPAIQAVSGTVSIGNFPLPGTQAVTGSVSIANSPAVTVGNAPDVGQTRGPWAVSGAVSISGAVSVLVANGANVALGSTADSAVTSDASGTVTGFLRGLVRIVASAWDSLNGRFRVDGSGVTQPISGSVVVSGAVTANQGTSPWVTRNADTSASGTLSAVGNSVVFTNPGGMSSAWISIPSTNSPALTITFEVSADGGNTWLPTNVWWNLTAYLLTPPLDITGITPVLFGVNLGGLSLRVRCTARTSGIANVTIIGSAGNFGVGPLGAQQAATYVGNASVAATDGFSNSLFLPTDVSQIPASYRTFLHGYSAPGWDRWRLTKIFKTATATVSGSTALWTPATNKKVRLLRYCIELTNDVSQAVSGAFTVSLLDASTDIAQQHSFFVPGLAGTTPGNISTGWIDLGNGILSGATNRTLNISLPAALVTGLCRVLACGTEE